MEDILTFCVAGGSGFIGRHLIPKLSGNINYKLRYLSIEDQNIFSDLSNVSHIKGNLLDPDSVDQFVSGSDILINLAYLANESTDVNLKAVENLLRAAEFSNVRRFIHCSTAVVAGNVSAPIVNEQTGLNPVTAYEKTKCQIEYFLKERKTSKLELAVVRPTAVFGPYGSNLNKIIRDHLQDSPLTAFIKKALFSDRALNLVSVENVTDAIIFLSQVPASINNEIFIISDDCYVENNYMFVSGKIEEHFGLRRQLSPKVVLPKWILRFLLYAAGKRSVDPQRRYSAEKLEEYGFLRSRSFSENLVEYLEWFKKNENIACHNAS
ncbi:MAG: NAD(P)-dependent oxidoreductase [Oligoflexales bacterium]|nr:NAD(P)-dependent oxidoreductase [Oligoflexales bacterium]